MPAASSFRGVGASPAPLSEVLAARRDRAQRVDVGVLGAGGQGVLPLVRGAGPLYRQRDRRHRGPAGLVERREALDDHVDVPLAALERALDLEQRLGAGQQPEALVDRREAG